MEFITSWAYMLTGVSLTASVFAAVYFMDAGTR